MAPTAEDRRILKLAVVSHKPCWESSASPSGYATDGGFPFQMRALSELFDATTLLVPTFSGGSRAGELPLTGHNLTVSPLTPPRGRGFWRKAAFPFWLLRNMGILVHELSRADAVHAPIPGDIGTAGILMGLSLGKRLFVRHCGNWFVQETFAERFWKWLMERFAGGNNVMLATGGAAEFPSKRNTAIRWIFSTSLTEEQLQSCFRYRERLPGDSPRLIIVCRQERDKGTGVLIESLPLLLKDFPGATLDVVGDGGALTEFRDLAARLGIADRVTFHGKLVHAAVLSRLQEADLFCFPTVSSEGFPKVVLEAMACGLPVLTTRVSVLPQLIGCGCGALIEEVTAAAVAEGVRRCFSDEEGFRRMSATAIETARGYSLERWREAIGDSLRLVWGPLRSYA